MSFDRVFADKEFLRNLAVTHALRNQFEDLELASGDAEVFPPLLVRDEGSGNGNGNLNFLDNNFLPTSGQLEAQPDTEDGKGYRDQARRRSRANARLPGTDTQSTAAR
ncbi:hypothetical protein ACPOL_1023 [Acidisarcina polymorpha]|uniref:Uncharacterized protein n=1 Tax=Acidisarcina polymorpha TaxID=2211140 RepID=A0A2Z5FV49_9BACT|nr:hypothetical protein [Acidisarcina polymorpha]AXC10374.1 hypothetical protein ACPOL_1023 [Acidisarcina polymorpha]